MMDTVPYTTADDGVRIAYKQWRSPASQARLPLVLVQGMGLSGRFWFDQPERVIANQEISRDVLIVDNRGTGKSGRGRAPYRMETLADDVRKAMDAAGIGRAIVAGVSLGGMIAQHFALRHADRIGGLILLATTPGLPHGHLPGPRAFGALIRLQRGGDDMLEALGRLLVPLDPDGRWAQMIPRWQEASQKEPPRPPIVFLSQLSAAVRHSTGSRLPRLVCPTVIVAGALDRLVPPENAHVLGRLIPNSAVEILPGVGHGVPLSDPTVIERALLRLERTNASSGTANLRTAV